MSAPAARALLLVTLCALSPTLTAHRPLRPRNVKLTSVDRGLKVTWDPPNELDGRPVDRYSIGYGKSMRTLRFITVDKDQRSEVLEDVEPGVLHYLKMSAENEEGLSKPVYRAETPGGGEWVKLDGFAVVSGSPVNSSSTGSIRATSPARPAPPALASRQIAPQSSSGPDPPRRSGYLPIRSLNKHKVDVSQHQADQRNGNKPNLASESVYVVSLQAQRPQARSAPVHKALVTKKITPEPEDVDEVKDITVRVMSAQSVLISWVDPVIEKKKNLPEGSRHYTVRYREKGESARWEYKETTQRRLMIETLSADGMYEFSIRVSQGNTDKKWSASVFQRTPESAPSGPPENFQVKPIRGKGTAVTVTWDSPEEPNGRIREYILSYAPALKPFGAKSVTYRGTTTSAVVDGLQPGEHYIFKIRAANRRGQGPQSKAFSLAVPETSTADSTSSSHSKKLNKPISSNRDSSSPQDTQNTDSLTTTAPPTTRRTRPLSQTRSYHSIFSSVRGSVRNGALNPKTVVRSPQIPNRESNLQKEEEKEKAEMPIVTPKVDLVKANEAIEDTVEPETMNNKDTSLNEEDMEYSRASSDTTNSSSNLKKQSPYPDREDTSPSSSDTLSKRQEGRRITHLTPRQSSIPDSSRLRRPISRTRMRNRDSSSLSHTQESPAITKDHTPKASSHSEGKDYNNVVRHTDLSTSAPTTKKTTVAPQKESSSGSSRGSSPVHRITGPRSGSSFSGGREKDDIEHKPDSSAAATLSQPTQPRRSDDTNSQSKSIQDTRVDQDSDHHNHMSPKVETAKSEPPPSTDHTDTSESTSRKTENPERGEKNPNPGTSPLLPSRTNSTGRGSSLSFPSRSSRIGAGSRVPTRQDGRFPWSRTASSASVGAGRPILRGTPSRAATSETQAARDRAKASTTSSSSGDGVDSHSAKDAVSDTASSKNLQTLSNSQTNANNPILSGNTKGNNAAEDDLSAGVKESYDSLKHTSTVSTAQPKTTSSTVGPPQRLDKTVNESVQRNVSATRTRSQFPPTYPRKPLLGSNGRFRSPVLSSRLNGSRFPGKLQPLQHTRLGSSSSVLTQPDSNGRLGPVSRSSLRQTPSSENPHDGTSTSKGTLESSQSSSQPARNPVVGSRLRYPGRADTISRGKSPISGNKPSNEQGKNGRPNLTASNGKMSSTSDENIKSNGVRHIIGPDGTKWVIDLDKGVLMNENGKVLQDSRGRPKRVVLGEDGKTIFDEQGSPLVNQEGLALFGHSRDSRPVVNPKEKYLTLGGKSVVGLDQPKPSTTTTTTTPEPTMEPTTTEFTTIESTTMSVVPTCPPGTFSRLNDEGFPVMDADGVLDCYPDDDGSGMEMDSMVTITMAPDNALDVEEGEFFIETTLPPTTTPTTPEPRTPVPRLSKGPSSQLDAAGKKRFTAPYVNYIQKDPGSPCSLTEALEYLQVDVLENLMKKDILASQKQQPPKNKPHNITVVAMEGCHSFIILDWARPLKDDMVSGYMVHSASYDDVLNNRWSSRAASGTHLSVENLKPNSRYYFKVQAKNTFGLGPISDTFEYITESDDPLLIERPPGGEPIWIPFTFKYNPAHSACKGSQYVKRTWYRKFVGVVLCNSLRYKIFMGDGLKDTFYSVADTFGSGEDHCQFVDSYLDGRTGAHLSMFLPTAQGYYRSYRQEPVSFGSIGRRTPHPFVGWYECGVPIPGKW